MAILGQPYPIMYFAKNGAQGLTNIKAKIRLPDGSFVGPFTLSEVSEAGFEGSYIYEYATSVNDQQGEYLIAIEEPTSGHTGHSRITLEKPLVVSEIPIDLKRNGFTEILVKKDKVIEVETSSENTIIEVEKKSNIIIMVSDDDTEINTDDNNINLGV